MDGANSEPAVAKLVSRIYVVKEERPKIPVPCRCRGMLGWGRGQGRLCRTPG